MATILGPNMYRHCSLGLIRALSTSKLHMVSIKPNSNMWKNLPQNTFVQEKQQSSIRIATFHGSSNRSILPPLPQVINGTANDAAPVPSPDPSHGSYHWTFERLISAGLIPLTIVPFAAGSLNPTMDAILCAATLIHSHIGFQAVIIDYLPRKRVPTARLIFWWALRVATIAVGVGLYEFETNDVGVTAAIARIWRQ